MIRSTMTLIPHVALDLFSGSACSPTVARPLAVERGSPQMLHGRLPGHPRLLPDLALDALPDSDTSMHTRSVVRPDPQQIVSWSPIANRLHRAFPDHGSSQMARRATPEAPSLPSPRLLTVKHDVLEKRRIGGEIECRRAQIGGR